jgi:hypothetical protein
MAGSTLFFLVCDDPKVVPGTGRLSRFVTSDVILCFAILCTQLSEMKRE